MRAPWQLDAPEGYNWTEEDAAFERADGFWAGLTTGLLIGAFVVILAIVFLP